QPNDLTPHLHPHVHHHQPQTPHLPHPLHPFPTRRSSDLPRAISAMPAPRSSARPRAAAPSRSARPSSTARRPTLRATGARARSRSEEHTSELLSPCNLVCRLLLEKKKISIALY